jgi:hypothetical protein
MPSFPRAVTGLLSAILLAALVAQCGRSDAPEPAAATPNPDAAAATSDIQAVYPTDSSSPDPLAQRLCDALQSLPARRKAECCGTSSSGTLADECVRGLTATLRSKAVALDASRVDRCVEESSRAVQGCGWVTPLMPQPPEACRAIVAGLLDAGASCRSSLDCRDGLTCRGASPTSIGVCAAPAPAGESCGGPADTLALYVRDVDYESRHPECQGYCRGGLCADVVSAGGACSSSLQCGPGAHCASGKCVIGRLPALGQACGGDCAGDARCTGGQCVALKPNGESCTSPFECQVACVIEPGAQSGICGPLCSYPVAGSAPVTPDRPN